MQSLNKFWNPYQVSHKTCCCHCSWILAGTYHEWKYVKKFSFYYKFTVCNKLQRLELLNEYDLLWICIHFLKCLIKSENREDNVDLKVERDMSLIFYALFASLPSLLLSMLNHNYFLWVLLHYNKDFCVGFSESCWSSLSISRGLERRGVRQRGKTRRRLIKMEKWRAESTNFKICGSYVLTNYWFTKFMKLFF